MGEVSFPSLKPSGDFSGCLGGQAEEGDVLTRVKGPGSQRARGCQEDPRRKETSAAGRGGCSQGSQAQENVDNSNMRQDNRCWLTTEQILSGSASSQLLALLSCTPEGRTLGTVVGGRKLAE